VYFVMNELLQLNPILPDSRYKHDRCWRDWDRSKYLLPGRRFLSAIGCRRALDVVSNLSAPATYLANEGQLEAR
jgi:hypothetical protein